MGKLLTDLVKSENWWRWQQTGGDIWLNIWLRFNDFPDFDKNIYSYGCNWWLKKMNQKSKYQYQYQTSMLTWNYFWRLVSHNMQRLFYHSSIRYLTNVKKPCQIARYISFSIGMGFNAIHYLAHRCLTGCLSYFLNNIAKSSGFIHQPYSVSMPNSFRAQPVVLH